ncbi:MAG: DUF4870 domain-containing protein [Candidatus Aenigmatarchaeota archaeon]
MERKRKKRVSGKTSLGWNENLEALLAYSLGWPTGIAFYLLEKKSRFVKFHALQSTLAFLALNATSAIVAIIPIIGAFLSGIVFLLTIVVWIVCMIKAYQGEQFELPLVGEIAKKNVK